MWEVFFSKRNYFSLVCLSFALFTIATHKIQVYKKAFWSWFWVWAARRHKKGKCIYSYEMVGWFVLNFPFDFIILCACYPLIFAVFVIQVWSICAFGLSMVWWCCVLPKTASIIWIYTEISVSGAGIIEMLLRVSPSALVLRRMWERKMVIM